MSKSDAQIGSVQTLNEFLSTTGTLTLDDLKTIVEQAIIMLEESYVHLPLKIAMHAVNPLGRLRILRRRLDQTSSIKPDQELDFHEEMLDIFTSLRDLHTNYMLPKPFSDNFAILPFLVESCGKDSQRRFFVTQAGIPGWLKPLLPANFEPGLPATFKKGVEITYWNGVRIQHAVEINANKNAGSNSAASFANGLESMTIRPMLLSLPPDEEWVVIGYRTEDGRDLEYRQEWLIVSKQQPKNVAIDANSARSGSKYKIGLDLTTDLVRDMKQTLFAPESIIHVQQRLANAESVGSLITNAEGLDSIMPKVLRAKKISEDVGYIRIYTFDPGKKVTPEQVFNEFVRLMLQLPKKGLIIDVRANGGGYIELAESLLQLLTPHEITPEPYQFISSPLTLEMARGTSDPDVKRWESSLSESVSTGSTFSRGFLLTTIDQANNLGQLYHGPVILVTDGLCYSATDLFAAGFQDHQIGPVLGVDPNTGAGGANVWEYGDLRDHLVGTRYELKNLPSNSNMRVAIRRNVRVGDRAGTPVEDLGIIPDILYDMSRRDLLEENVDLIKKASEILAGMPVRQLEATLSDQGGSLQIGLTTLGISRVDVYVDGRPVLSQNVTDGINKIIIDKPSTDVKMVKIIGLKGSEIVATRKVSFSH
jgi:C-terminal processing protease CtpA/Prc